jgi:hypothetical protein
MPLILSQNPEQKPFSEKAVSLERPQAKAISNPKRRNAIKKAIGSIIAVIGGILVFSKLSEAFSIGAPHATTNNAASAPPSGVCKFRNDGLIMDDALDTTGYPNPVFYICEPPVGYDDGPYDWQWTLPDPGHLNAARRYTSLFILNAGTPGMEKANINLRFVTNDGKRRLIGGPYFYRVQSAGPYGDLVMLQFRSYFSDIYGLWMWVFVAVSQPPST